MPVKERYYRYPEETRTFRAKTVVITGVSGGGPTKFLHEVHNPKVTEIAKIGEMLFEDLGASSNGPIKTKNEIRHSSEQKLVLESLKKVMEKVGAESAKTELLTLVDAQVVFEQGNELYSEGDLYCRLDPLAYVFLRKDPEQIWQRREKQNRTPGKRRQTVEEIRSHQREALLKTFLLAKQNDARFLLINNTPVEFDGNVNRLKKFIEIIQKLPPRTKIFRDGRWNEVDDL